MTPVRAIAAALLAAIMVVAGALIVARAAGREAADLFEVLLAGPAPGLLCFLAAAGAVLFGAGGVLTAFLAFIAREEDEDDDRRFRRRGFPKSLPLVLIILSLALVWVALRCAASPAPETPVAVAVEPEAPPAEEIEEALAGGERVDAPAPPVSAAPTRFSWSYQNPLIRSGGRGVWLPGESPFTDDQEARALLCDKAWIAVTGSASEEGPAPRNKIRSLLRAIAADNSAQSWIRKNPDCVTGSLFAVDLGQHERGSGGDAQASAYQRQVLVISRARREGESLTADAAKAELAAFLADPATRAQRLGGRRFQDDPVIFP